MAVMTMKSELTRRKAVVDGLRVVLWRRSPDRCSHNMVCPAVTCHDNWQAVQVASNWVQNAKLPELENIKTWEVACA